MKKTCKKYAVHKSGTEVFGSLCSYREEALDLLHDLQANIVNMPEEEKRKFYVAEVNLEWNDES